MKQRKIQVAILFGGKSAEHEVSVQSAKNVYDSLDKEKYDAHLIGIDKRGYWHLSSGDELLQLAATMQGLQNDKKGRSLTKAQMSNIVQNTNEHLGNIDVVFPVLHGPFGEDGSVQGFLKLMDIPFVGAGVLGSAVGMDKDVMKRLLRDAGVHIGKFLTFNKDDTPDFKHIVHELGLPFFVKPANLGSSIGVKKVKHENEFEKAIENAFQYDTKILIEEFINGDEIFCSVLGNESPIVSVPGRLKTDHEFYDYDAKYIDEIEMEIPAKIPNHITKRIQEISLNAYKALCCEGMARADLFLTKDNTIYLGEINTIPGFTSHSWYPKLWEASGISQNELVDRLIQLAIKSHENQANLKTTL